MANAAYTAFLAGLPDALYDLNTASIKVAVVRGYTFSAAHATMSDVTGAGATINGTSAALTNPTLTGGVFNADNTTVTLTSNGTNHYLILFQASAVTGGADVSAANQRLIAYLDTGTGLPIVPGAGSLSLTWNTGTNKILKIG